MPQIAQVDTRVPIELVDLIAFHLRPADGLPNPRSSSATLRDGLAGLHACSLVCHQWRAVVLPHLFFSITCKFLPEDAAQPVASVGRRRPYKTISLFCRFLENTPAVRESIHQLLLMHQYRSSHTDGEHELDGRLFARLLQLCPRLDVLHLHRVKFLHVSASTLDIPQSRALKALKIMPCHEGNLHQDPSAWYTAGADVAALSFFSSIDHLHLLAPVHGTLHVPEPRPLTVRHLEVENAGYGLRALVAALERCGAVQTITALTMTRCVRCPTQPVSPELARLVALLSPILEEVTVRGMFHNRENVAAVPDLSRCMRLRALHVRCDLSVLDVSSAVVDLLGTVPPTAPLGRLDVHMTLPRKLYEPVDPSVYTTSATIYDLDDRPSSIDGPTSTALSAVDAALMQVVKVHDLPWVTVTYWNALAPDAVKRVFARLKEAGKLRVRRERV